MEWPIVVVPNYRHAVLIACQALLPRAEHVAYLRFFNGANTVHTAYDHPVSYNAIGTPSINIHHIG
jgi:hypothetical protein